MQRHTHCSLKRSEVRTQRNMFCTDSRGLALLKSLAHTSNKITVHFLAVSKQDPTNILDCKIMQNQKSSDPPITHQSHVAP